MSVYEKMKALPLKHPYPAVLGVLWLALLGACVVVPQSEDMAKSASVVWIEDLIQRIFPFVVESSAEEGK